MFFNGLVYRDPSHLAKHIILPSSQSFVSLTSKFLKLAEKSHTNFQVFVWSALDDAIFHKPGYNETDATEGLS